MSSKKQRRREAISALVLEQGAVTGGSLADRFDVSMETIRRDVDALCEGNMLHRVHGRIELSEEFLNTPFDQRAGTNLVGKKLQRCIIGSEFQTFKIIYCLDFFFIP